MGEEPRVAAGDRGGLDHDPAVPASLRVREPAKRLPTDQGAGCRKTEGATMDKGEGGGGRGGGGR